MIGIQREINWLKARLRPLPVEYRDTFLRDTGEDNLIRLQILGAVLAAFSIMLFIRPGIFISVRGAGLTTPYLINIFFGATALLLLFSARFILSGRIGGSVWISRFPIIIVSIGMLWWGSYAGSLSPFGLNPSAFFVICLFLVCSLFILSMAETIGVLVNGLLAYSWFNLLSADGLLVSTGQVAGLVFVFTFGFVISRMLYFNYLSAFLNWENISAMNRTLKREIVSHQQTLEQLEAIRSDLNQQVNEKTSFLRETNQRLQEEIAERTFADRVRSVLYRIASLVNQNRDLEETIRNIHDQLRQILDVTNFMVGIYDEDKLEIEPVYQENLTESFESYRLGRTLSSYMIRNRKPLLVDKKGIRRLVAEGEVEIVGVLADSWLGVPLLVEDRVVGVLIVQSYKPSLIYDSSDLQLLEYASGHLALAIDRHQIQDSLIRARDQAEESDRLKSAFLSNLSHEIRTPLNSIMGFAEMINEPGHTEMQLKRFTAQVVSNGQELLNTVTNMVDLARLQVKQMSFTIQSLDSLQILDWLRNEVVRIAQQRNKPQLEVLLSADPGSGSLNFQADPERLKQMAVCLAENAVKFTSVGYIEIGYRRENPSEITFWVRDTGIGMEPGDLGQIFEWFTKGQAGTEKIYRGSGLGLTISRLIIEQMNGRIWAESEPGNGSCFYFTLPLVSGRSITFIPERQRSGNDPLAEDSVHAV